MIEKRAKGGKGGGKHQRQSSPRSHNKTLFRHFPLSLGRFFSALSMSFPPCRQEEIINMKREERSVKREINSNKSKSRVNLLSTRFSAASSSGNDWKTLLALQSFSCVRSDDCSRSHLLPPCDTFLVNLAALGCENSLLAARSY